MVRPRPGALVGNCASLGFRSPRARGILAGRAKNLSEQPSLAKQLFGLPKPVRHWSLTTLREKLIKIGAKVTRHSKYVTFQLAEVSVTRNLFAATLDRIAQLAITPQVLVCGITA
jgi:hypothetical protein